MELLWTGQNGFLSLSSSSNKATSIPSWCGRPSFLIFLSSFYMDSFNLSRFYIDPSVCFVSSLYPFFYFNFLHWWKLCGIEFYNRVIKMLFILWKEKTPPAFIVQSLDFSPLFLPGEVRSYSFLSMLLLSMLGPKILVLKCSVMS